MGRGGRSRGPVDRIGKVGPIEGTSTIDRVRALEALSSPTRLPPGESRRTFTEVLERRVRGSGESLPHPGPVRERPPLPPLEDDLEPISPPAPGSFLDRLWRSLRQK